MNRVQVNDSLIFFFVTIEKKLKQRKTETVCGPVCAIHEWKKRYRKNNALGIPLSLRREKQQQKQWNLKAKQEQLASQSQLYELDWLR